MRTIQLDVFQFNELSDKAKTRARDWYRECSRHDQWWDGVYEMAETAAKILGIKIDQRTEKNRDGDVISRGPCIFFTGFSTQGDGACFEGTYRYRPNSCKDIRAEFPEDKRLHDIADSLHNVQDCYGYELTATVTHSGRYYHSFSADIETDGFTDDANDDRLKNPLREFMDWIYRSLEEENDNLNSDETVEETILANEYEFTADGSRFEKHG